MNLTEPQIEAVFEWIDLNVDRKTAIRFVKDFYKRNEWQKISFPIPDLDLERVQSVIKEQVAKKDFRDTPPPPVDCPECEKALKLYTKGTKIKSPLGYVWEVIEIIDKTGFTHKVITALCKKVGSDKTEYILLFKEPILGEPYWAKIVTDEETFDSSLSPKDVEMLYEYKEGAVIETYSFPGDRIRIDSTSYFMEKNSIMMKCIHPIFGSVSAAIATKNFMNTGNTYWATIVK